MYPLLQSTATDSYFQLSLHVCQTNCSSLNAFSYFHPRPFFAWLENSYVHNFTYCHKGCFYFIVAELNGSNRDKLIITVSVFLSYVCTEYSFWAYITTSFWNMHKNCVWFIYPFTMWFWGWKSRALHMLSNHSTPEQHVYPWFILSSVQKAYNIALHMTATS